MKRPQFATRGVTLLAGASGLVGRELLARLLADESIATVLCLGRRAVAIRHPKLVSQVVDFTALPALPAIESAYIALGTTLKVAGSKHAFRSVDLDAVVAVAAAARAAGASRAGVVSAMGANARSRLFFNLVKGEMEDAVSALGFPSLVFARPALLAGDREALGQLGRSGEKLALMALRFDAWLPANYRVIDASRVAAALHAAVSQGGFGNRVLLSGEMQKS